MIKVKKISNKTNHRKIKLKQFKKIKRDYISFSVPVILFIIKYLLLLGFFAVADIEPEWFTLTDAEERTFGSFIKVFEDGQNMCLVCKKQISTSKLFLSIIIRHVKSKKHFENMQLFSNTLIEINSENSKSNLINLHCNLGLI